VFTIECPQHEARVLVTETRIRSLRNISDAILVDVECWCGCYVTVRTGRDRPPTPPLAHGAASLFR
jgi:hypothetical protein